jgi:hypothetical protein
VPSPGDDEKEETTDYADYAESESKFFLKVVDGQITFVKDEQGKVTGLILHQGGRDLHAKKIE